MLIAALCASCTFVGMAVPRLRLLPPLMSWDGGKQWPFSMSLWFSLTELPKPKSSMLVLCREHLSMLWYMHLDQFLRRRARAAFWANRSSVDQEKHDCTPPSRFSFHALLLAFRPADVLLRWFGKCFATIPPASRKAFLSGEPERGRRPAFHPGRG